MSTTEIIHHAKGVNFHNAVRRSARDDPRLRLARRLQPARRPPQPTCDSPTARRAQPGAARLGELLPAWAAGREAATAAQSATAPDQQSTSASCLRRLYRSLVRLSHKQAGLKFCAMSTNPPFRTRSFRSRRRRPCRLSRSQQAGPNVGCAIRTTASVCATAIGGVTGVSVGEWVAVDRRPVSEPCGDNGGPDGRTPLDSAPPTAAPPARRGRPSELPPDRAPGSVLADAVDFRRFGAVICVLVAEHPAESRV